MRGRTLGLLVGMLALEPASAIAGDCRVIEADFLPAESPNADPGLRRPLQIVAWLETPDGTFVDTIFITQETGSYGLGNRPGRFDFNSAPLWPYGRRTTVFPVWSHRKGLMFPEVEFQNSAESELSHPFDQSSSEKHYCAPLLRSQPAWDAASCASQAYSDKGVFSSKMSLYPPRQDIARNPSGDSASVTMYGMLNPYDAVSQATPPSGHPAQLAWSVPPELAAGSYVLWVEVAREFDQNATYTATKYPPPTVAYGEYGQPYRGQPSVLYKVPFALSAVDTAATTTDYAGYGDPDGLDGDVRAPDGTITIDTPGSGAQRLALVASSGGYRIRVTARHDTDTVAPVAPQQLAAAATSRAVTLSFIAPGDDGLAGKVRAYEVRYLIGEDVTEANFATATEARPTIAIADGGSAQTLTLDKLLPETDYAIGIRAVDDCGNHGPVASARITTLSRQAGEVDACFIATAAYGSLLANDVEMLRRFRDVALKKSVLGELFVETYYTFGPTFAGVVGESELLRSTAREILAPIVSAVRVFSF